MPVFGRVVRQRACRIRQPLRHFCLNSVTLYSATSSGLQYFFCDGAADIKMRQKLARSDHSRCGLSTAMCGFDALRQLRCTSHSRNPSPRGRGVTVQQMWQSDNSGCVRPSRLHRDFPSRNPQILRGPRFAPVGRVRHIGITLHNGCPFGSTRNAYKKLNP